MSNKNYCVDLDGVIFESVPGEHYHPFHFGKPLPGAALFCKMIMKLGRLIIHSARCYEKSHPDILLSDMQKAIEEELNKHSIPFDEVYIGKGKPLALAYIDDKAIEVPRNPSTSDYLEIISKLKNRLKNV